MVKGNVSEEEGFTTMCSLYWIGLETVTGPQYIFQIIRFFSIEPRVKNLPILTRLLVSLDPLKKLASLDRIKEDKIQLCHLVYFCSISFFFFVIGKFAHHTVEATRVP